MIIGTPKEKFKGENRVALTPQSAQSLIKLGYECVIETNAGINSDYTDKDYLDVGVKVLKDKKQLWKDSDIIIKVKSPDKSEESLFKKNQILISFFYPNENKEILKKLAEKGVTTLALDMVPRISRAQKMDALSSMANIAGYRSVIEASNSFGRFFTGQITAAGRVPPAKILVVGAGVAGLAAIGTSQSMGAIVRAFDVRPEVAEQIESMGAEFLFLDFEENASGDGGYAAPSSPEFQQKQLNCFKEQAPEVDIVILTALIPGRDAPKLWLKDMVDSMKIGSVIVDLAAERGGNCELTEVNKKIQTNNGVTIIGFTDFPSRMANQSSNLLSSNIKHLLDDLTPKKDGIPVINFDDDVVRSVTVTHENQITFPPPPLKIKAIADNNVKIQKNEKIDNKISDEQKFRKAGITQVILLIIGVILTVIIGAFAPSSFMQHFIVFILSCFVGFQVIWNVSHALHTPLMAVTNAISGIIIIGALLQIGSSLFIVEILAGISILIATINIVGGFVVTRRMLSMFKKS